MERSECVLKERMVRKRMACAISFGDEELTRMETLSDLFRPHKPSSIAERVGVSSQTVSAWQSGRMDLFYAYIQPLAKFLGVDRQQIIDACFATSGRPPVGP